MGFETIVRPVVFPNIRPAPAQVRPPAGDPEKGICTIHGSSGQTVDLPFNWSINTSSSRSIETKRRSDEMRIYQMDDDGNINEDNFVDVKVANKIWMKDGKKDATYSYPRDKDQSPNIEIIEYDRVTISNFPD